MAERRKGLNCTLTYPKGKKTLGYRVRANLLMHGMQIIADESQGRTRKAFYPHRLSSAQFAVGIELKGEDEYTSFSNWLAGYAKYVLDMNLRSGEFPAMGVSIPAHGFLKKGVPLTGYEWGDKVGAMVWTPTITFETVQEPGDPENLALSKVGGLVALTDPTTQYFYPTGPLLSGGQTPPDGTYAKPVDALRFSEIAGNVGAGSANSADHNQGF
jgi:hypothetical protein